MKRKYNFIDLFAGCGGLSEGFYQEDFFSLAHVEINKIACNTLRERMRYYNYEEKDIMNRVLEEDITREDIVEKLDEIILKDEVDIIIGGPPCQSFSTAGRVRDKVGMSKDPRNYLFKNYVKILNHYLPKFFVFENVKGILNAKVEGKLIINDIIKNLNENYDIIDNKEKMILNAANYGVPQLRERVIILGVRKDLNIKVEDLYNSLEKTHFLPTDSINDSLKYKKYISVQEAIGDLPFLLQGEGEEICEYSHNFTSDYIELMKKDSNKLFNHVARKHNSKDVERYREMAKNRWTFQELLTHRQDLIHEKRRLFNNSYVVQWKELPSKTIIAHLYKDGNQFIHPDYLQGRSFTVREAARIQSFPDNFLKI